MTSFVNDPSWVEAAERRDLLRESAPYPPWCVRHHLPLGLCDHCGSTVALGRWTACLNGEELRTALTAMVELSVYRGPEKDALIHEAIERLA